MIRKRDLDLRCILFFLIFAQFFILYCQGQNLQCKGERNQDVDWYVLYKIPKIQDHENPLIKVGEAYLYISSDTISSGWTLSKKSIGDKDSIPGNTLSSLYNATFDKDNLWILYNDQPPNMPWRDDDGHSKGAVLVNNVEGFWLVHSVPHFPPDPSGQSNLTTEQATKGGQNQYSYPKTGRLNGQSFLCVSMKADQFENVGKQLQHNEIIVFQKNLPDHLADKFKTLIDAAYSRHLKKPPFNNIASFQSLGGETFISFAKGTKYNKDLYEDFVAPQLKENLYVETWLNGPGRLPSDCKNIKVMNIKSIKVDKPLTKFDSSHDHSKWAISFGESNKNYVCIGDINRASTQFKRGGGTVCFSIRGLWDHYNELIGDVESCRKNNLLGRIKSWFG